MLDGWLHLPGIGEVAFRAEPQQCRPNCWPRLHRQAQCIELNGVADTVALKILASYVDGKRLQRDMEGTGNLLRLLGGIPRNFHVAGRALRKEIFTTPGQYAERLREQRHSGDQDWESGGDTMTWEMSLKRQMAVYMDLRSSVTPAAWSLFESLGAFSETPFTVDQAAEAGSADAGQSARLLAELSDVYLLDFSDEDCDDMGRPLLRLNPHTAWLASRRQS